MIDVPDRSVIITFDSEVTGYSCNEVFDNETETAIYRINAWTTTWDLHLSNRGKQNMVIPFDRETEQGRGKLIGNTASGSVLAELRRFLRCFDLPHRSVRPRSHRFEHRKSEFQFHGQRVSPCMPYFLLAFLALVVLAILRVLLRNKQAIIVWIDHRKSEFLFHGQKVSPYFVFRD